MNPPEKIPVDRPRPSFWRKLGGGSLTLSLIIHGVLLVIGIVWILRIIPPPTEKKVDFMPQGGGGGSPSSQSETMQKRQANMVRQNAARVAALDVTSNFTLPDPEVTSDINPLDSLGVGGLSGGLGGSGSGGGKGSGIGKGFGAGSGLGSGGIGAGMNPFGMLEPSPTALIGTFYDLKQTRDRKPTGFGTEEVANTIRDFVGGGWKDSVFDAYYEASQKLYQTKIYMPMMQASAAPAAFNCEKEVEPSRWVVVYRGTVTPPRSGRYRFVGAGDDVLVVRLNGKHVFDHGYTSGTTAKHIPELVPFLKGERSAERDVEKLFKTSYPMELPVQFYRYDTTKNWNDAIGGLAVGATFTVTKGTAYPIEILISEIPGGLFCASLMIEQVRGRYDETSDGTPILPIFRLDNSLPEPAADAQNAPPFDKRGPVWTLLSNGVKPGI